jgi:hypothetical protein
MISRKTAVIIQQLYEHLFCKDPALLGLYLEKDELHYFLYEDNHEGWFLDIFKRRVNTPTDLKHFILDLHTGMAYTSRTQNMDQKRETGQRLLRHLAISILKALEPEFRNPGMDNNQAITLGKTLLNRLTLDGHLYKNGKLFPLESSVIDEQEEQSVLEDLIKRVGLQNSALIQHHLELCEQAYLDDRWNDTISNARNFLEATLREVAEALHLKLSGSLLVINRPVEIRDYLEDAGLIDSTEKQAIVKVYGLLSHSGSHPNIAAEDEARLMRNLSLVFSQYVLLQWEGYLRNIP